MLRLVWSEGPGVPLLAVVRTLCWVLLSLHWSQTCREALLEVTGPPWVTDIGKVQVIPRVSVTGHRPEPVAEISRFLYFGPGIVLETVTRKGKERHSRERKWAGQPGWPEMLKPCTGRPMAFVVIYGTPAF